MFVEVLSENLVMSDVWFYFLYLFFHRQQERRLLKEPIYGGKTEVT